jgi:small-conductance mechanosensitive channel
MAAKGAIVTVQDAVSDYQEKRSNHFPDDSIDAGRKMSTTPINREAFAPSRRLTDTDMEEEPGLTQLGLKWQRIRRNVLLRYIIYIVPVAIMLAIPIVLCATVYRDKKIISKFTTQSQTPIFSSNVTSIEPNGANGATTYNNTASTVYSETTKIDVDGGIHLLGLFVWIEVVWVLLWVAKLLAQAVPIVFQTVGGAIHTGIRKYWLVLKAVEIPLSLFFWAILSIASWSLIYVFDKEFHADHAGNIKWLHTLHNVLKATVGVTALYLVQRMLIQMISVSYHGKQFYDNIKEIKTLSRAVETMYDVSRQRYYDSHPLFIEDDLDIHDTKGYRKDRHGRLRTKDQSTAEFMSNLSSTADKLTSVVGYLVSDIAGKQVLMPTASGPIVEAALERPVSAEALARRIWNSFTNFGETKLDQAAIIAMLGAGRESQAVYIHSKVDADENGDLTLEEMIELVKKVASDRQTIWEGANNVKDAIKVLDRVLGVFVLILVFLIYAAFFSNYLANHYTQIWSTFTGCSFLFASTAGELFAACITVFIKHPYDVGDRINVNDTDLDVVKISLLYSVFRDVQSKQMVQIPNSVINGVWIKNLTRSKELREQITLNVNVGTSFEDIGLLRDEMLTFLAENKRDFHQDIDIQLFSISDLSKLELRIEFQHKAKFASDHVRAQHRSKFICALLSAVRKVPIDGPGGTGPGSGSMASPNYTVAITDDIAQAAKAKFDAEKDAKRLVPKNAPSAGDIGVAVGGPLGSSGLQVLPSIVSRRPGRGSDDFTSIPLNR